MSEIKPKKRIVLKKISKQTSPPVRIQETNTEDKKKPKLKLQLKKKSSTRNSEEKKIAHPKVTKQKNSPKPKRNIKGKYLVRVCTSLKSCGDNYGPYIWERLCNEHDIDPEQESFEAKGIEYQKSQCQGFCKKKSNVQVIGGKKQKTTQFHYMNPIKGAKLMDNLEQGANPDTMRRL